MISDALRDRARVDQNSIGDDRRAQLELLEQGITQVVTRWLADDHQHRQPLLEVCVEELKALRGALLSVLDSGGVCVSAV